MQRSGLALLLCAALLFSAVTQAFAESEAEFKKMNVRQLKKFLDERDVDYRDITEKSEFVSRAVEWAGRNKKVVRDLPKEPFWEVWAKISRDKCEAAVATKGLGESGAKVCDAVASAVDSFFMMNGKRTASKLKKKPDALTKTANGDIYYNAGSRIIARLLGYCLNAKNRASCSSSSQVVELMDKDTVKGTGFGAWITNVGIENTNPMYELSNSKSLHDEL
ncbi:membrane-associated protein, putative [Bodo saltans]|uniref:Membrane-associated protein, putative n=1 Tax=Bodo saltans TaxID=75058 RepID=A0A0S4IZ22_BODSA|nr:membrane-associated protein, putative [Bodo saltans]|eukprot:CUG28569.1 membrane-associated protein, putative [Bodo saltans]